MTSAFHFVHVLGAIAVGYYILFPILMARVGKLGSATQEGYVNALHIANRIGQYILILQFITGGYLISKANYTVAWIVIVIVVFVLLAAFAGMMGRPMKRIMEHIKTGKDIKPLISKVTIYSLLISISFIILVVMMSFPTYKVG